MKPGFDAAYEAALKCIARRDHFSGELRSKLVELGFEPEIVETVLERLIGRRIIDDRRTLTRLMERASGKRSVGIERFRAEMLSRGAPEMIIEECLVAWSDQIEADRALAVLTAKKPRDPIRAARYLASKGFDPVLIESVVERFFNPT